MNGKDAESILKSILGALKEDGLDFQNLIGLGTDGANVLIGHRSGVCTRLKELQPELIGVKCVCHSLAKVAEYAFRKLPSHLEVLVRDIYSYFSYSSSRKDRYAQVQSTQARNLLSVRNVFLFMCFCHSSNFSKRIISQQVYQIFLPNFTKIFSYMKV